ncbi:MAG: sialidase family protein [Verrucomicrobiota bacterium JB022]|nr:sialidase family protein [Verrucomicrobiota bacterium JB022]
MTSSRFTAGLLGLCLLCWLGAASAAGPGSDSAQPSLYRDAAGTLHLTWSGAGEGEAERAIWHATLTPEAPTWSAPQAVVSTPLLLENWADFATTAVGTDGTLWAQWYQRRAGGRGYDGWFARSTNDGASWSTPVPLGHEFVSLAPLEGGRMMAVWLEKAPPAADQATYAPSMQLSARLLGPEGQTLQDWVVDPDVCTCCQTTLAALTGGRLLVAYRGHTPEEIRDNHVAVFENGDWQRPQVLHADGWMIPGCPVNGPAADGMGERAAVAWFTAAWGKARVQVAFSGDGGDSFGAPIPVDLGQPIGRVDLVSLPDGSAIVSWLEVGAESGGADLYVRQFRPTGPVGSPLRLAALSSSRASGFPRMAVRNPETGQLVISYTEVSTDSPPQVVTRAFTTDDLAQDRPIEVSSAAVEPASPPCACSM